MVYRYFRHVLQYQHTTYMNVNNSVLGGGDPHFMIRIKGMTHPLCFDFPAKPGDVLRLLSDTKSGSC